MIWYVITIRETRAKWQHWRVAIPRWVEAGVRGRADRWLSTRVGNLCETRLEWQKLDPYLKFKLKGSKKIEGHLSFTDIGYWCVWCFVLFFFTYVFFPRASERRVLPIVGVCISSSHLHICSSSHLLIFTSAHLHIFSSSHLLIFTSAHLHICSSSHLLIFTPAHLHICSSSHLLIFTSAHLHICSSSHLLILLIFTSAHLHICSSSHLLIFTSAFSLSLFSLSPSLSFSL